METTVPNDRPMGPALLRSINEREIYRIVRSSGPIHRAEVARLANLSKPTAAAALQSLVESGLLREVSATAERPGRATVLFEAVPDVALGLALDIGARFVRGALCDTNGEVVRRTERALIGIDLPGVLATIDSVYRELVPAGSAASSALTSMVVGSPGVVDPNTGVLSVVGTLPSLEGVALASLIQQTIGRDVTVENDVNLAALGEQNFGQGRDVADFVVVSVGSGLGAGIVLGGELRRGRAGLAGEVDFVPFRAVAQSDAFIDPSSDGLLAHAGRAAGSDSHPDVPSIFAAARAGSATALALVAAEARAIALYVTAICAVLDIDLVVLTGGIGGQADLLIPTIESDLSRHLPLPPRVLVSDLGTEAVLAGARTLASRNALASVINERTA